MIKLLKWIDQLTHGREGVATSWPLPARIVVVCFLFSVGIGFVSALVNLHFQEAGPGKVLPDGEDVVRAYHGEPGKTQLERLLSAPEALPFNGSGSMRAAFTEKKGGGLKSAMKAVAAERSMDLAIPAEAEHAKAEVLRRRDGERLALIAWIRSGAPESTYDEKGFELKGELAKLPITKDYLVQGEGGPVKVHLQAIVTDRCCRCHAKGVGGSGAKYPLETYEEVKDYLIPDVNQGKSLDHLALTTHVHLLAFSVLYGLTGMLFALTAWPLWMRLLIAPAPILFAVLDISFWWLARLDDPYGPMFAKAIMVSGGLVGLSLGAQIVLGALGLFRLPGKIVIVLIMIVGAAIGLGIKVTVVDPYMAKQIAASKHLMN
jgi:hypothetical protein